LQLHGVHARLCLARRNEQLSLTSALFWNSWRFFDDFDAQLRQVLLSVALVRFAALARAVAHRIVLRVPCVSFWQSLAQADLIVVKGDANYRRILRGKQHVL
jgi:hypothetical protein